jgi:hypothetical protein
VSQPIKAEIAEVESEFHVDLWIQGAPVCVDRQNQHFQPNSVRVSWNEERTTETAYEGVRASSYQYLTVSVSGPLVNDPGQDRPAGHRNSSKRFRQERGGEWDELPDWLSPAIQDAEKAYHEFCARIAAN